MSRGTSQVGVDAESAFFSTLQGAASHACRLLFLPFTSMDISAIRMRASAIATFVGSPPRSSLSGPHFVTEGASRTLLDVTAALCRSFGQRNPVRRNTGRSVWCVMGHWGDWWLGGALRGCDAGHDGGNAAMHAAHKARNERTSM
jgi:hypothetical protein